MNFPGYNFVVKASTCRKDKNASEGASFLGCIFIPDKHAAKAVCLFKKKFLIYIAPFHRFFII